MSSSCGAAAANDPSRIPIGWVLQPHLRRVGKDERIREGRKHGVRTRNQQRIGIPAIKQRPAESGQEGQKHEHTVPRVDSGETAGSDDNLDGTRGEQDH
jgi:hypothetical protein